MFPLIADVTKTKILVIGNGPATARRLELLGKAGVAPQHFGAVPDASAFAGVNIVFAADFDDATSKTIYELGKQAGALVNVEDKKEYCDFHVPAIVRRGDLLITVSTGGKSPRLARKLRERLERQFPEQWQEIVDELGEKREVWKKEGKQFDELSKLTDKYLAEKGVFEE